MDEDLTAAAARAFAGDDAEAVRAMLARQPTLRALITQPIGPFDSPAIVNVRSREMLDVLLDAGADIDARSTWWAGGFGLLDNAPPDVAAYAIQRGATVTPHAAARLGLIDRLHSLVEADPAAVHRRGGDGQMPLHVAANVETAALLLDRGADIDARDVDHESTPAQYMSGDRQAVARHLVSRGCWSDLMLAAALGDIELAGRHLNDDPGAIRARVDGDWYPMRNPRAGGTIYQWTLGFHVSPHLVARRFDHDELLRLLVDRSPADVRLIDACWSGDERSARAVLAAEPGLADRLTDRDRRQVAHAARNNETQAVAVMLACGWPVEVTGQHDATPLHWAAFHGNTEMARAILAHGPPLDATDADYGSTPLGWAIHGSEQGWYARSGDYGGTVAVLLEAGARPPAEAAGSKAVRDVLGRFR